MGILPHDSSMKLDILSHIFIVA